MYHARRVYPTLFTTLVDITTLVAANIFKLSDSLKTTIYFWDYEKLYAIGQLDRIVTKLSSSIISYLIIHPTPPAVFDYLRDPDSIIGENSSLKPYIFDLEGSRLLTRLLEERDLLSIPTTSIPYYCFSNLNSDTFSCATRIMKVLGMCKLPRERLTDIDKLGMWPENLRKLMIQTWHPDIYVDELLKEVRSGQDPRVVLRNIHSAITFHLGTKSTADPSPAIYVFIFRDHISFAVRQDRLLECVHYANPSYKTSFSYSDAVSKFPEVTGRPGGKIFIRPQNLSSLGQPQGLGAHLVDVLMSSRNDWQQILPTSLILSQYLDVGGEDLIFYLLLNRPFWRMQTSEVSKFLKSLHLSIRVGFTLPGYAKKFAQAHHAREWSRHLYGLDTIIGRSDLTPIDVGAEQVMRTGDPVYRGVPQIKRLPSGYQTIVFSKDRYFDLVNTIAQETAESLLRPETRLVTFDEYFASRLFWGASGGAPGATIKWESTGEKLRLNKRGAMLSLSNKHVRKVMDTAYHRLRTAVQWSVAAIKYESGKQRVILNTVLEHYVIQGYIQYLADLNTRADTWYAAGHDNSSRLANMLRRLKDLKQGCGYMWDYADFNINHIFYLMNIEASMRVKTLLSNSRSDTSNKRKDAVKHDLESALAYVHSARVNTYVVDQDSGITVQTRRGLQSGERSTSATNTDSNETDINIIRAISRDLLGYDVLKPIGDKTGDDAFLTTNSVGDAVMASCLFNLSGAAGQITKINLMNFEYGAGGEFLRMHYDSARNSVNGYPLRAVMGLIHGEFFSDPLPQPFERAAAFHAQVTKLERRGWKIPVNLLNSIVRTNCRLTYTKTSGDKQHFYPDMRIVLLPTILGGVGVSEVDKSMLVDNTNSIINLLDKPMYRVIYIPSGEGKTSIAKCYPSKFVDHDVLTTTTFIADIRKKANHTGDWKPVNKYLQTIAKKWLDDPMNKLKTLLTWGPGTAPQGYTCMAFMLKQPTGLRANISNRKSIISSGIPIIYANNVGEMFSNILATSVVDRTSALFMAKRVTNPDGLPHFQYPEAESRNIIRDAKTSICDFTTLHNKGITPPVYLYDAILKSTISGGWPKKALYDAIALYAKRLISWSNVNRWEDITVKVTDLPTNHELQDFVRSAFDNYLGILGPMSNLRAPLFKENDAGFPRTRPIRHTYGMYTGLVRVFNASIAATVDAIVAETKGRDALNRLNNALTAQIRQNRLSGAATDDKVLEISQMVKALDTESALEDGSTVRARIMEWCRGEWNLIPPRAERMSADLVTFIRDLTLLYVVQNSGKDGVNIFKRLLRKDKIGSAFYIYALEAKITQIVQIVLNRLLPGIELCD
jgi:hypothetical protein